MPVELIHTQTSDGVRLDGILARPTATAPSVLPFDAVVLHHGAGANFYTTGFLGYLTDRFVERGVAVLRVNSRGHDLLYNSPTGRQGAATEIVGDCVPDWRAWLDCAEGLGFRRCCVAAHSLGAVKSVYYAATQADARVHSVIAMSPPRFNFQAFQQRDPTGTFDPTYQRALSLQQAGEESTMMAFIAPVNTIATAAAYLDKFGPADNYDVLRYLAKVPVPTLLTMGQQEDDGVQKRDVFSFKGMAPHYQALADSTPALTFQVIPGAEHFYRSAMRELWATVDAWLGGWPVGAAATDAAPAG